MLFCKLIVLTSILVGPADAAVGKCAVAHLYLVALLATATKRELAREEVARRAIGLLLTEDYLTIYGVVVMDDNVGYGTTTRKRCRRPMLAEADTCTRTVDIFERIYLVELEWRIFVVDVELEGSI